MSYIYNIEVRRPNITDKEELYQFFRTVIQDTFAKEGLSHLLNDIQNEIVTKKQYLQCDFDSNGENRYFLLAIDRSCNKIVGTIEYGLASELIRTCTNEEFEGLHEIGTVFVLPSYQKRGIGSFLFHDMLLTLQTKDITEFCLDSGYTNAQTIWKKKFGRPDYLLTDYWGVGCHHMIWRRRTTDLSITFNKQYSSFKKDGEVT